MIHPDDFEEIRLSKASGSGDYLTAPVTDDDFDKLWNKRVVTSPVIAEGTALVGAFADGAVVWDREEARISWAETGLGDAAGQELFTRNQIRARGEERIAAGVTFPQAFCAVDLVAAPSAHGFVPLAEAARWMALTEHETLDLCLRSHLEAYREGGTLLVTPAIVSILASAQHG